MPIIQGLASTLYLFEDIGGFRGSDERLGLIVVLVNVSADGHNQLLDIAEDASSQGAFSEIAEESFDHVQPRTAGGCEREIVDDAPATPEPSDVCAWRRWQRSNGGPCPTV
jgi:hypothetical protein